MYYYRCWLNLDTKDTIFIKDDIEYNHFSVIKDNKVLSSIVENINEKVCSYDDYLIMIGWAKISIHENFKTEKTTAAISLNSIGSFNYIKKFIYETWKINLKDIDTVDIDVCNINKLGNVVLNQYNLIDDKIKKVDTILIPMDYDNLKLNNNIERTNV